MLFRSVSQSRYRWKEWVNIGLSANTSRQETGYAFNPQQNQLFYNQSYSAEANINFLKQYMLGGNFNYLYFKNRTTGFEQSLPILNVYLSRFVMKNKKGEIRISGILTCFPSTTHFCLALGADSPCADERCAGNLGLTARVLFLCVLLLY